MTISKYLKISYFLVLAGIAGCTKLEENYKTTIPKSQASAILTAGQLLQKTYDDIPGPFAGAGSIYSFMENTTDESLVPTRGGDWDDNGAWRVLHNHTWNADNNDALGNFNSLNSMSFDATQVLQADFNPTPVQVAEATFLRDIALYYLLDVYNQFPVRQPGESLLNAPTVYVGIEGAQFIIDELTAVLPDLNPANPNTKATPDAAKTLLIKLYLNKGAYANREAPTFDDADMQQVITLGNSIISSGKYSYMPNYFGNFNFSNSGSTEGIFIYPGHSGQTDHNPNMNQRYMNGFHYNEYNGQAPNAGWNGFTTTSDFYNSFSLGGTTDYSLNDTIIDTRIGRRKTSDPTTTINSGIRPGFLVGQQFDQNGVALKDRKGNPLFFEPNISPTMIENGNNLEVTGFRICKYPPDFSDPSGKYYSSNNGNSFMFFRYPEVVLSVAEAYMRQSTPDNAAALLLVNGLRTARGASVVASLPLNPSAGAGRSLVDDPNCLLAERGRELYGESVRRTDLIRFGVFLTPWQYKPTDDPKYLVFPIPNQALSVNPNLTQNPGY
jgi:hypothetical protein